MPLETVEAFQDHGERRGDTLAEGVDEAHALLDELAEAGVDYDDVVATLEREGVEKFSDSFRQLLRRDRRHAAPRSSRRPDPPSTSRHRRPWRCRPRRTG